MYSITLQNAGGDNVIGSGDKIGRINFAASAESDGGAATYIASYIACEAEGSFTSSSNPAGITFATSSSDSLPATGRLNISSDGNFLPIASGQYDLGSSSFPFRNLYVYGGYVDGDLGIGTPSPSYKLDVTDDTRVRNIVIGSGAYGADTNYEGLTHLSFPDQSEDYMIISNGQHTLVSSAGDTYVRASGNDGGYQLHVSPTATYLRAGNNYLAMSNSSTILNEYNNNVDLQVKGENDDYLIYTDANIDRVGIGKASPEAKLHVFRDITDAGGGTSIAVYTDFNSAITANDTNFIIGHQIDARNNISTGVTDGGYIMGGDFVGVAEGGGTITHSYGIRTYAGMHTAGSGVVLNAYGVRSRVLNLGSGSITNGYGLFIDDVQATNGYGIYQIGSNDKNYFNGSVGIGTASPSSKLHVSTNTEYGLNVVQSGVTNSNVGLFQFTGGNVGSTSASSALLRVSSNSNLRPLASFDDTTVITADGSVGIGTASPSDKLDVYTTAVHGGITVRGTNAPALNIWDMSLAGGGSKITENSSALYSGVLIIDADTNDVGAGSYIDLRVDGDTKMVIDHNGYVGINTTTPLSRRFNVKDGSGEGYFAGAVWYAAHTGNGDCGFALVRAGSAKWSLQNDYSEGDNFHIRSGGFGGSSRFKMTSSETVLNEDGNSVDFRVEGDSDPNLLFTDASADSVGIGTPSPSQKLDIRYVGGGGMALIKSNDTNQGLLFGDMALSANNAYQGIKHVAMTGIYDYMMISDGGNTFISAKSGNDTIIRAGANSTNYQLRIKPASAEFGSTGDLFKLNSAGAIFNDGGAAVDFRVEGDADQNLLFVQGAGGADKVGIGTASPATKLHIKSDTNSAYGNLFIEDTTSMAAGVGGSIVFGGAYTTAGATARYGIISAIKENSTSSDSKSAMVFYTNDSVGTTVEERMRITSDGRVGIGTASPSYKLDVSGSGSFDALNINDQFTFPTGDGSANQVLVTDGNGVLSWENQPSGGTVLNETVNGRLTLESGEPVSTTNQTAKTTLYFTPYKGSQISLYDGTIWGIHSFSELSLSLSGYTANTNYDIFVYDNSGTLTLESTAWTDDTTRATALVLQDGVYVKSAATTRRYLGTIRTTGTTGQCEDSLNRRFVWNLYNQTDKLLTLLTSAIHSYTTATWRPWNNNTTIGYARHDFIIGLSNVIDIRTAGIVTQAYIAGALDMTNTWTSRWVGISTLSSVGTEGSRQVLADSGYHFVQGIQYGLSASSSYSELLMTTTFRG